MILFILQQMVNCYIVPKIYHLCQQNLWINTSLLYINLVPHFLLCMCPNCGKKSGFCVVNCMVNCSHFTIQGSTNRRTCVRTYAKTWESWRCVRRGKNWSTQAYELLGSFAYVAYKAFDYVHHRTKNLNHCSISFTLFQSYILI